MPYVKFPGMRPTLELASAQDVWPTATRLATVYAGGGNGVFGAWDSGLQFQGPSAPYLKFTLGTAKVLFLIFCFSCFA